MIKHKLEIKSNVKNGFEIQLPLKVYRPLDKPTYVPITYVLSRLQEPINYILYL